MTQYLHTLKIPLCPYCQRELTFSSVGFVCGLCPESIEAKIKSAEAMLERKANEGYVAPDTLKDIQKETK